VEPRLEQGRDEEGLNSHEDFVRIVAPRREPHGLEGVALRLDGETRINFIEGRGLL
jgi:hypothetical protein